MEPETTEYTRQPCVVVRLRPKISNEAVLWLAKRIQDNKVDNGCQLDVDVTELYGAKVLYISASKYRLLHGAEAIGLKKEYKDGTLREFCFTDRANFKHQKDDDFLSESEQHQIVKVELDGLRAIDEKHIPSYENIKLYPGKSIFRRMVSNHLVTDNFPLHDIPTLHKLRWLWYKTLDLNLQQPLDHVRSYFGDSISIYFAFLNFYTLALVPLVVLGLLHWGLGLRSDIGGRVDDNWVLSVIHVLWAAAFLEMWKRKSTEYSYKWGTLGAKVWEEPRTGYRGPLGLNEVTQRQEPTYPSWKRNIRVYLITCPVVLLCVALAVCLMFYYFSWEIYLTSMYRHEPGIISSLIKNAPSIVYSILVLMGNSLYRKLAEFLTDQENHRLESTYQNHLITKILVFDFSNNFLALFYIAFIYDDMPMLRQTLRNLFLVHMIVSQALESLLPYWQFKYRSSVYRSTLNRGNTGPTTSDAVDKAELNRQDQTCLELQRDTYEGTFDDYLELWLQFGYVVMFSCVYPPAAIFALINNIIEMKSDAFKICNVYRRPFVYQTTGIGTWKVAFQALSYLAVVSNLALIFHTPRFIEWIYKLFPDATTLSIFTAFVVLEHLLLGIRWLISYTVPVMPLWVKIETRKMQHYSLQALKRQRSRMLLPAQIVQKNLEVLAAISKPSTIKEEHEPLVTE
ncbi:anoctamin-10-like [Ciona intestinalis]